MKHQNKIIIKLGLILFILYTSASIIGILAADTTPPQLEISTEEGQVRNQTIILHGMAVDESGIQSVTVNGIETTGTFTNIHYFWVLPYTLDEGVNIFVITATDNSEGHLTDTKELVLWYNPDTYEGPSIKLVPVDSMPSNNASISCIVNPNGRRTSIYLSYAEKGTKHSPFNSGRGGWSDPLEGNEDILVTFKFERDEKPSPGNTIEYVFKVENGLGYAYSEVGSFLVTDPIELPPEPDTTPPDSVVWDHEGVTNREYVVLHGRVWDESGVSHVLVNGENTNEFWKENEWLIWTKTYWLEDGENDLSFIAFDNFNNSIVIQSTLTYQVNGYSGPTIELVPHEDLPIDNAIMYFYVNPNGNDRVWVYVDSYSGDGGSGGQTIGGEYSGNQDILVSYLTPQEWLRVGEVRRNVIKVGRGDNWSFVEANHSIAPPDYISPTILGTSPSANEISVSLNSDIVVYFDEPLNIFSITDSNCLVNNGDIECMVLYDSEDHSIFISPTENLDFLTTYTVTIGSTIMDYTGNNLQESYSWNYTTVGPTIDKVHVTDDRCNVNTTQYVSVHLGWGNGTDISSASIFVNEEEYITNQTGWISLPFRKETSELIQNVITGVQNQGLSGYIQLEEISDIIWDRVIISVPVLQRIDLEDDIQWSGEYTYDGEPFEGNVIINTVDIEIPTKIAHVVQGIIDPLYWLTDFEANEFEVIYDKVIIELLTAKNRINVGSSPSISSSSRYAYDLEIFQGQIEITKFDNQRVGKVAISVDSIVDSLYDIKTFEANDVEIVFDQVEIYEGGISNALTLLGDSETVWFKAQYEYDSELFSDDYGKLWINGDQASWNNEDERWEITIVQDQDTSIDFEVTKIEENRFDLSNINRNAPIQTIEWQSPEPEPEPKEEPEKPGGIPGFKFESIFIGVVISMLAIWIVSRRKIS